jgi:hypothetical protein
MAPLRYPRNMTDQDTTTIIEENCFEQLKCQVRYPNGPRLVEPSR